MDWVDAEGVAGIDTVAEPDAGTIGTWLCPGHRDPALMEIGVLGWTSSAVRTLTGGRHCGPPSGSTATANDAIVATATPAIASAAPMRRSTATLHLGLLPNLRCVRTARSSGGAMVRLRADPGQCALRTIQLSADRPDMRAGHASWAGGSAGSVVEVLQQPVGGQLDLLVAPLGGPVEARDSPVRWTRRKSP